MAPPYSSPAAIFELLRQLFASKLPEENPLSAILALHQRRMAQQPQQPQQPSLAPATQQPTFQPTLQPSFAPVEPQPVFEPTLEPPPVINVAQPVYRPEPQKQPPAIYRQEPQRGLVGLLRPRVR